MNSCCYEQWSAIASVYIRWDSIGLNKAHFSSAGIHTDECLESDLSSLDCLFLYSSLQYAWSHISSLLRRKEKVSLSINDWCWSFRAYRIRYLNTHCFTKRNQQGCATLRCLKTSNWFDICWLGRQIDWFARHRRLHENASIPEKAGQD